MPAPTRPTNFPKPFALSGTRNTIPDSPTGTNHASFTEGFPAVTMQPITSGGIPPSGDDFNGLFYDIMTHTVWGNAGGQYQFDAALSTAMGGYPQGMVLQSNDGLSSYVSLVNNNTTDFNSTPSSIGSLWGTFAGASFSSAAISTTGGTTTVTASQLAANVIIVSGLLTSNVTLTFPASIAKYFIINSTTGAFLVNAVASGLSVQIKQGYGDLIFCDGVNMKYQQSSGETKPAQDVSRSLATTYYADRASSRVGGYSTDTGAVNAYAVTTIPPTSAYVDGQTVRFVASASSTGASTLNAGPSAKSIVRGDGSAIRPNDILSTGVSTVTYKQSIDKWILNGLIVPDSAILRMHLLSSTQTMYSGDWLVDTSGGPFACNLNPIPVLGDAITFRDAIGSWTASPFTIIAGGSAQFCYLDGAGNVSLLGNSLTDNLRGHEFTCWFDGTNWRLI